MEKMPVMAADIAVSFTSGFLVRRATPMAEPACAQLEGPVTALMVLRPYMARLT